LDGICGIINIDLDKMEIHRRNRKDSTCVLILWIQMVSLSEWIVVV